MWHNLTYLLFIFFFDRLCVRGVGYFFSRTTVCFHLILSTRDSTTNFFSSFGFDHFFLFLVFLFFSK